MGTKDQDYKEMFVAEALENYEELNKLFTLLEKDIKDKKAVNHIFRITHTLKGNAMGMGFESIAELAHVMEDVFSEVKEGRIELDDDLFNNLFKANDKLGLLIEAINSGEKVSYKGIRTKLTVFLKNIKEEDGTTESSETEEIKEVAQEVTADENEQSLFDLVGGKDIINDAVNEFYKSIQDNDDLKELFEGVDLRTQKAKHRSFYGAILGGPDQYTGNESTETFGHLADKNISQEDFVTIVGSIHQSLEEVKMPENGITEIVNAVSLLEGILVQSESQDVPKNQDELDQLEQEIAEELSETEIDSDDQPKIVFSDLVQVPVRKLDSLMNLVGELIIERDSLISTHSASGFNSNMLARLHRITSDLQYGVMDVRLIQIGFMFNKFHRIIRDVANIENKKVDLNLEGTEIEIDRNILKTMSDSLIHLIRNSVSHGIESPEKRKKLGKPERGQVTLSARNEKDTVIIDIKDDGAGIDANVIAAKALKMGMVSEQYIKQASDDDKIMLIFEPGFSNADKITEVSGRGVGMDVVKRATESIGGNIKVKTEIGKGSTISLSLPSSMAVKGALLFELNEQEYAVALSYTEAVVSLTKKDIHKVSNGLMASYLGKTISIIFLNDLYDIKNLSELGSEVNLHSTFDAVKEDQKLDVLVASYGNKYVGFVVDKLLQQKEIVEKTLEPPLHDIGLISGATILGNGNVCLVLDIANIIGTLFKDKN